jgi:hypothetical protein
LPIFSIFSAPILCDDIDLAALKAKLPASFQNLEIPTVEQVQKVVRDKCISVSGSDAAYDNIEQAPTILQECLQNLLNVTKLQEEITAAKPTGDLDTVFNK